MVVPVTFSDAVIKLTGLFMLSRGSKLARVETTLTLGLNLKPCHGYPPPNSIGVETGVPADMSVMP